MPNPLQFIRNQTGRNVMAIQNLIWIVPTIFFVGRWVRQMGDAPNAKNSFQLHAPQVSPNVPPNFDTGVPLIVAPF